MQIRPAWACSLIALLLFFGAGRFWFTETRSAAQDTPGRFQSLDARINGTVREAGTLETAESLELQCQVPGTTTLLFLLPDGSSVQKGDLVARLDDSELREQLAQQKIAVATAQAEAKRAELAVSLAASARDRQLKVAELELELARQKHKAFSEHTDELSLKLRQLERAQRLGKLRLDTAQRTLSLSEQAFKAGKPLQIRPEQARLAVQEAMAELENVEAELEFLQESQYGLRAAELKLLLLDTETGLQRQRLELESEHQSAVADLKAAEAKLAVAQERFEQLETQIAACALTAPRDGVIVHANANARRTTSPIAEGASIREGQIIVRMPRLDQLRVRVRVHESRINRVQKGQPAAIRFDALPETEFAGKVIETSRVGEPAGFPNTNVTEYSVLVALEEQSPALRLGMTCVVEIRTDQR